MRKHLKAGKLLRRVAFGAVLLTALLGYAQREQVFTTRDKAFFADPKTVSFVRPGLVLKIVGTEVKADGSLRAHFTLTDPKGLPLDRDGIVTPGSVSTSFMAAYIPAGQTQYVNLTTRVQTSPITNTSATQGGTDSGGTYEKVADGEYWYNFKTKLPATDDPKATHTVGAYSSRNLSEFDLGTQYSDAVYNFVPSGGAVTVTRAVVNTANCNQCHDPLSAHGGARKSVELCVLCHNPQSKDPDTGNTIDFPVMVHKIHRGSSLPSVVAGGKYQIIGFNNSVNDYSTVTSPTDVRNCAICHVALTGQVKLVQQDAWYKANRAACGACHDNVNFATGENHVDLPQVSDNQCSQCHIPQGELEFDASILGAHTIPEKSRDLPGTVFGMVKVDDGTAGKKPTVTFTLKDKAGKPILPSEMTRFALVLAGPTADYASYVSEDARKATGSNGTYSWTFANALAADAKGTFTIGAEGYRNVTLLPGTKKEMLVRDAGANTTISFAVGGTPLAARRKIVDIAKCNTCHTSLSLHGGNRNQIEQCVLCHNPNTTDVGTRPAALAPAQSV
ncbi:MAG: OmcA/MtrC family decaheme c-type cytochrome, partial [Bryobacteraceae bacterium]